MLITFEGIDGSGKTTQAARLLGYLRERNIRAHIFREPGGTPLAENLRNALFAEELDARTELLLLVTARADLCSKKLLPLLRKGEVVILDRFTDSTLAYQGYGRGLNLEIIKTLNTFSTFGLSPDITFLLDLDPQVALLRIKERTRFDDPNFLEKVRAGYLQIARDEPDRVVLIDSSKGEEEVFGEILKVLRERVGLI